MKTYIWLTFGFMGWGYYELSGGADFVPEERPAPVVVAVEDTPAPEIVTRADTAPTLLAVSASNVTAPRADLEDALTAAADLDAIEEPEVVEVVAPVVPTVEDKLDIRAVAGTRVNMRMGPGTTFDVITTLDGGTKLEVLEVNADGWANVATVDRGIEGWMAERLLTSPET